jgi:hypothetical protein
VKNTIQYNAIQFSVFHTHFGFKPSLGPSVYGVQSPLTTVFSIFIFSNPLPFHCCSNDDGPIMGSVLHFSNCKRGFETVVSKLTALMGGTNYCQLGVPFTGINELMTTCSGLHAAGFQRMGREQLYSDTDDSGKRVSEPAALASPVSHWMGPHSSDVYSINVCATW